MRVQIKFVIFLFFLNVSIFSTEYLSSNGNIFFTYSEKNHRIEKINMNIENRNKSIDFMKIGFFVDGRQYEIGENNYTVEKEEQSNIVKLSGKFAENSYEIFIYPSINEKNDLMKILIASMDENHDNDSDKFWADIAKNRFEEIESKKVQTLNWNQIKQQVLS